MLERPSQFWSLFSNTSVLHNHTRETWRMECRVPSKRLSPFALLSSRLSWVGLKDSETSRLHPASGEWNISPHCEDLRNPGSAHLNKNQARRQTSCTMSCELQINMFLGRLTRSYNKSVSRLPTAGLHRFSEAPQDIVG